MPHLVTRLGSLHKSDQNTYMDPMIWNVEERCSLWRYTLKTQVTRFSLCIVPCDTISMPRWPNRVTHMLLHVLVFILPRKGFITFCHRKNTCDDGFCIYLLGISPIVKESEIPPWTTKPGIFPPSTSKTGQLTPWLVFKVVLAVDPTCQPADPTCQPHLSLSLPFLSPSLLSLSPLSSARAVKLCRPHIELLTSGIGFVRLLLSACTMQMLIRLG